MLLYIYHKNKLNKKKKTINKYGEQPGIFCQKYQYIIWAYQLKLMLLYKKKKNTITVLPKSKKTKTFN